MLSLIKEFEAESFADYGFKCEDCATLSIMPSFLNSSLVMVIEGEIVGVIAGAVNTCPTDGSLMFQEALWFVKKEYRSRSERLFKAMEGYCENVLKVKKIVMCLFGSERLGAKDRFFKGQGYRLFEQHYLKLIGG